MRWGLVRSWPWWKDLLFLAGLVVLIVALVEFFS